MRRKAQKLKRPFPATAPIPDVGLTLFNADWHKSYELARRGIIDTIETGKRGRLGLVHVTARKLGLDPTV
jgi:hypothetical protein